MADALRHWCARCQFDGKEPFILGTAHVPAAAQHHEVEAAAYQMMDRLFPSRPVLLALLPGARPSHPDWHRSIRDQCAAAGVAFFFKQHGEWADTHPRWPKAEAHAIAHDGTLYKSTDLAYPDGKRRGEAIRAGHDHARLCAIYRVGKSCAGRLLDGIEHNQFPEVR